MERKEASKMAGEPCGATRLYSGWLQTAGLEMRGAMRNSAKCETCWHYKPLSSHTCLTESLLTPTYEADTVFLTGNC